jgi:hypothetical protein
MDNNLNEVKTVAKKRGRPKKQQKNEIEGKLKKQTKVPVICSDKNQMSKKYGFFIDLDVGKIFCLPNTRKIIPKSILPLYINTLSNLFNDVLAEIPGAFEALLCFPKLILSAKAVFRSGSRADKIIASKLHLFDQEKWETLYRDSSDQFSSRINLRQTPGVIETLRNKKVERLAKLGEIGAALRALKVNGDLLKVTEQTIKRF